MSFTIEELQQSIADLPPGGYFYIDDNEDGAAIFYDFVAGSDFRIPPDKFDTIDAWGWSGWTPITQLGDIDQVNDEIAKRDQCRFRYIAIAY